jgi:hypothetical protein
VQLYVNKSAEYLLQETVIFELDNLAIEGLEGEKQVRVKVGPGEEQIIKLVNMEEGERKLSMKVIDKQVLAFVKQEESPLEATSQSDAPKE